MERPWSPPILHGPPLQRCFLLSSLGASGRCSKGWGALAQQDQSCPLLSGTPNPAQPVSTSLIWRLSSSRTFSAVKPESTFYQLIVHALVRQDEEGISPQGPPTRHLGESEPRAHCPYPKVGLPLLCGYLKGIPWLICRCHWWPESHPGYFLGTPHADERTALLSCPQNGACWLCTSICSQMRRTRFRVGRTLVWAHTARGQLPATWRPPCVPAFTPGGPCPGLSFPVSVGMSIGVPWPAARAQPVPQLSRTFAP